MKNILVLLSLNLGMIFNSSSQCNYISSTSTTGDLMTFSFVSGQFASFGCGPIDPTFWLAGSGMSINIEFLNPQDYPTFRVWGMNNDDSASVKVNGFDYYLSNLAAAYDDKVLCGPSPGPDGVEFANGKLVGANDNVEANYSYQNIQLMMTGVNTIDVIGVSGVGWGFAGASVDCPLIMNIPTQSVVENQFSFYPNPCQQSTTLRSNVSLSNVGLNIYNMQGRLMESLNNINGNFIELNVEQFSKGVYFVQILQNNKLYFTEKLIVRD